MQNFPGYKGYERVKVDGFCLGINLPPVLKQRFDANGNEITQGLPPYCPVECGVVDEYQQAPDTWMRGSANTGSFFFPTAEGRGLWLDFNSNRDHKHHIAVVVSIQGVNAVTGQKLVGFAPRLERYDNKCPVHGVDFGHDRYCEKCGYKWPSQNYIASTGTPEGLFWLDGFRNQNGQVRQFVFTPEEMKRGVAQNMIGNERVFAIGVAFFISKEPRKQPERTNFLRSSVMDFSPQHGGGQQSAACVKPLWISHDTNTGVEYMSGSHPVMTLHDGHETTCLNAFEDPNGIFLCSTPMAAAAVRGCDEPEELVVEELLPTGVAQSNEAMMKTTPAERLARKRSSVEQGKMYKKGHLPDDGATSADKRYLLSSDAPKKKPVKLEVGAGARIDQQVFPDPEPLDFWRDEPETIIYLNYADEATVQAILGGGRIDLTKGGEGYLAGLPVGDPPTGNC